MDIRESVRLEKLRRKQQSIRSLQPVLPCEGTDEFAADQANSPKRQKLDLSNQSHVELPVSFFDQQEDSEVNVEDESTDGTGLAQPWVYKALQEEVNAQIVEEYIEVDEDETDVQPAEQEQGSKPLTESTSANVPLDMDETDASEMFLDARHDSATQKHKIVVPRGFYDNLEEDALAQGSDPAKEFDQRLKEAMKQFNRDIADVEQNQTLESQSLVEPIMNEKDLNIDLTRFQHLRDRMKHEDVHRMSQNSAVESAVASDDDTLVDLDASLAIDFMWRSKSLKD